MFLEILELQKFTSEILVLFISSWKVFIYTIGNM